MTNTSNLQKQRYNMTFCILSGLAIIMVAAGHLGYNLLSVDDLFPYYSFHVPLFLFISGYFYRDEEEEHPLAYVKKKCLRLLVPYLSWNLFYGLIALLMRNCFGMSMGEDISLRTLFLTPFLHGYQFLYNYAAWFVPVLFVIEMMNLLMRLIARRLFQLSPQKREWLYLASGLLVGMAAVSLAIGGHVWGNYKAPGRILFLYPCFQMGQFYRKNLEKHDTLSSLPYFAVLIGIQTLLHLCCNGLAFSSVWCTGFANGPLIPYVTTVSGIAFWLRIARLLTPIAGENRAVQYLGRNTFTVMMHHVMIFMLIKMILAGIAANTGFFQDFDFERYRTDIDYIYLAGGTEHFKMVYLAAGTAIPLLIRHALEQKT
ncbi:MAG: acyltransferase family protein [Roseburia sp.]|nr:acyltransferase family protein [Roseburia sp.]MCM1202048.1 acyltransferase family protein [Bacteroides fragilis]